MSKMMREEREGGAMSRERRKRARKGLVWSRIDSVGLCTCRPVNTDYFNSPVFGDCSGDINLLGPGKG
eukprot:2443415-Rhodomonas_salina.1